METIHKQQAKRKVNRKTIQHEPNGIDKALLQLGIKYLNTKVDR